MLTHVDRVELWMRQSGVHNLREGSVISGPYTDNLFIVNFGRVVGHKEVERIIRDEGFQLVSKTALLKLSEDFGPSWAQMVCKGYALMSSAVFTRLESVSRTGTWPVYTMFVVRRRMTK